MSLNEQDGLKGHQGEEADSDAPTEQANAQVDEPTTEDDSLDMTDIAHEVVTEMRGEPQPTETDGEADPEDPHSEDGEQAEEQEAEPEAGEDDGAEEASSEDDDWLTDEEVKGLPPRARKRLGKLTRRAKEAEAERDELRAEKDEYQPVVDGYTKLASEMQEAGLDGKDLSGLLQFGKAMKDAYDRGDWTRLEEIISPIYQQVQLARGAALEGDLQERVDAGEITEDVAREYQRVRHQNAQHQQREQDRARREQEARQQQEQQAQATEATRSAIVSAAGVLARTHASFEQKRGDLENEIRALVAERGAAKTPDEGRELVLDAWNRVMEKSRPQRRPVAPLPRSQGARAATGHADPLLDEVHSTIKQLRAG